MGASVAAVLATLVSVAQGRPSLQLVILTSIALFSLAVLLFAYMMMFHAYQRLRSCYRARRRRLYDCGIEKVISEEPLETALAAFKPRRWGDEGIIMEVLTDSMRHLKGPAFETLYAVAFRLGFVERNLRRLKSRSKLRRGSAMAALGIMRAPQAIVGIIAIMEQEPLDMKLVALRALAAIGNPAVLPYFFKAADKLSPAMMVRLASLMLEFGPAARPWLHQLALRHRDSFPPRALEELLEKIAAAAPGELR